MLKTQAWKICCVQGSEKRVRGERERERITFKVWIEREREREEK